ncbi:MAG TPA: hypothetical protein VKF62_05935, partial [Planctomycetota bacterium]|nr:hypothetical protein [Planctomycetota bacterium]
MTPVQDAYLAARAQGLSVAAAARAASRDRDSVYLWRRDPAFAAAEEGSVEDARDALRDRIKTLALEGEVEEEETTFPNGRAVRRRRRRPPHRLIVLAARALPEFKEVPHVAVSVGLALAAPPAAELSLPQARAAWAVLSAEERKAWLDARGLEELPALLPSSAGAVPAPISLGGPQPP